MIVRDLWQEMVRLVMVEKIDLDKEVWIEDGETRLDRPTTIELDFDGDLIIS
jgi:hypothetical protein